MEEAISAQQSDQTFNSSGIRLSNAKSDEMPQKPDYSMPGILHFLQTKWAKFEMEKAQWEIEKAELQAKIAFLQGERKGQENLKQDLVRRIKMLEFALKQERNKYHKLKFGTELEVVKAPTFDKEIKDEHNIQEGLQANSNTTSKWKHGRQLLRQYLQEIGYTDTIIDVRSARVRQLLGLQPLSEENKHNTTNAALPDNNRTTKKTLNESGLVSTEASIMNTFDFLSADNPMDDEEDDDDDDDDDDKDEERAVKKPKIKPDWKGNKSSNEGMEEALAEFNFLVNFGDSTDNAKFKGEENGGMKGDRGKEDEWDIDDQRLKCLKEQYKKDRQKDNRKCAMLSNTQERPKRSALQSILDESSSMHPPSPHYIPSENGSVDALSPHNNDPQSPNGRMRGEDDALEGVLGLGELADLTLTNDADALSFDMLGPKDIHRSPWSGKFTLRSHFDGIRSLAFHPTESVLITASEDHLLKLWNLQKTVPYKRGGALSDVEPVYTFRGHTGPVLCVKVSSNGEMCYSVGMDGSLRCWNIPSANIDPYDIFDPKVLQQTIQAHTDAVWGLAIHSHTNHLLTAGSDATVKLWDPQSATPLLHTFAFDPEMGSPTSADFSSSDPNIALVGSTKAQVHLYDVQTNQSVLTLLSHPEGPTNDQINRVVSHPTLPITITAHEDRHIRLFDNKSGKVIHSMVAHLDAVTCLAVDPSGLYLLSGSHDCSIRLWSLETKTCVQEMTSHRKKFEEAIHDVTFHPAKPFVASAGADALAKVFV